MIKIENEEYPVPSQTDKDIKVIEKGVCKWEDSTTPDGEIYVITSCNYTGLGIDFGARECMVNCEIEYCPKCGKLIEILEND